MNSTLNAACSLDHKNTPSYHFKYINTCIMDMYLIIHQNTLSDTRDESHSVNRQGLCGSWFKVQKLLIVGINEPLFLSTWQKIMSTSGSRNGSNKSSIRLPLDRMAAVPASSTHSSLNANLLLRDPPPPFTRHSLSRIGQCRYQREPCLKNTKTQMSALLLGLRAEAPAGQGSWEVG